MNDLATPGAQFWELARVDPELRDPSPQFVAKGGTPLEESES